jgi:predicted metal-binding protein
VGGVVSTAATFNGCGGCSGGRGVVHRLKKDSLNSGATHFASGIRLF